MGRVSRIVRLAVLSLAAAGLLGVTGATAPAMIRAAPVAPVSAPYDFGDAPEGALAYSTGVIGRFPTCQVVGPSGWIRHGFQGNTMAWFGPAFDFEGDGNAGACPAFPPYNLDECFADGDAGLLFPQPFTIQGGVETPCPASQGTSLGGACQQVVWGGNLDIFVTNHMPVKGVLNVIADWDQTGMWAGAAPCPAGPAPEHVLVNWPVPVGYSGPVSGLVPPPFLIGPNPGYVWARFAVSEQPVLLPWDGSGQFEDGEAEDYLLRLNAVQPTQFDWGDAPDPSYPTLSSHSGANHVILPGFMLGNAIDAEANGQPDPNALGDDNNGAPDDEDGVTFTTSLVQGQQACVDVFLTDGAGGGGFLDAWLDFDASSSWDHPAEQIFASLPLVAGPNPGLCFPVPASAVPGPTFARFRLSQQGGLAPTGAAANGEVEDYQVTIDPVLTVTKALTAPLGRAAEVSDTVKFRISITNNGATKVTQLPLWDYYSPACLENPQANPPANGPGTDPTLGVLHWSDLGGLDPGATMTVDVEFHATVSSAMYWKEGGWLDYAPKGMPDFNQKQDQWDNPPGQGVGWYYCGPVAAANSLWWFDSKFEPNPISPPAINDGYPLVQAPAAALYDDHSPRNVQNFANQLAGMMGTVPGQGTNVNNLAIGIAQHINATVGPGQYTVTSPPVAKPTFEWIESEVRRSEDVILLLGFWQLIATPQGPYWERVGGHFVTVAGIDSANKLIAFSDPYNDRAELGTPWYGRVLPNPHLPLHPGVPTGEVHNDAKYASHDVYKIEPTASPGGTWGPVGYVDPYPPAGCPQIKNFEGQNPSGSPCIPDPDRVINLTTEVEYAVAVSPIAKTVTCDPTTNIAVVSGANDETGTELPEAQAHAQVRITQADYGDAPDALTAPGYPTLKANNGAAHTIVQGFYLGASVDAETDGQPVPAALGDDTNGLPDDEDGVAFLAPIVPGKQACAVVTASAPGALDTWIDFNGSGAWEHPGEHLFGGASMTVSAGTNHVCFLVPAAAAPGSTFARFRLSSAGGLKPWGPAPDGEVEDYQVTINDPGDVKWVQPPNPKLSGLHTHDYTSGSVIFSTTGADDWQCQGGLVTDLHWWGNYETGPGGVEKRGSGIRTFHLSIHESDPTGAPLPGALLWSMDVPFASVSETGTGVSNPEGSLIYRYEYRLSVPFPQVPGRTYWFDIAAHSVIPGQPAIWRWQESSRGAPYQGLFPAAYRTDPGGFWSSTNNSDMAFVVTSKPADLGDAPDSLTALLYPTLLANGGAAHARVSGGPFMGASVDSELDGQPNATATGDDINLVYPGDPFPPGDENGVKFLTAIVPGKVAWIAVTASGVSALDAWIDFNGNGAWDHPLEHLFGGGSVTVGPGTTNLSFNVPLGASPGLTFARFRLSSAGGLLPTGAAADGEVEDYRVEILVPPERPVVSTSIVNITTLQLSWPKVTKDVNGIAHLADGYYVYLNSSPYWTPAPGSYEWWLSELAGLPDPVTKDAAHLGDPSVHHFYIVRAVYVDIWGNALESADSNREGEFEFTLVPGSP